MHQCLSDDHAYRARISYVSVNAESPVKSLVDAGVVFFLQAEDGLRDKLVTGVQTCALPIFRVIEHFVGVDSLLTSASPYQFHFPFIGEICISTRRGDGFRYRDSTHVGKLAWCSHFSIHIIKAAFSGNSDRRRHVDEITGNVESPNFSFQISRPFTGGLKAPVV